MQKQFEEYLLAKNYRPTTSIDYPARLERLCRKSLMNIWHNISMKLCLNMKIPVKSHPMAREAIVA